MQPGALQHCNPCPNRPSQKHTSLIKSHTVLPVEPPLRTPDAPKAVPAGAFEVHCLEGGYKVMKQSRGGVDATAYSNTPSTPVLPNWGAPPRTCPLSTLHSSMDSGKGLEDAAVRAGDGLRPGVGW